MSTRDLRSDPTVMGTLHKIRPVARTKTIPKYVSVITIPKAVQDIFSNTITSSADWGGSHAQPVSAVVERKAIVSSEPEHDSDFLQDLKPPKLLPRKRL